jgi:hypothetical protein
MPKVLHRSTIPQKSFAQTALEFADQKGYKSGSCVRKRLKNQLFSQGKRMADASDFETRVHEHECALQGCCEGTLKSILSALEDDDIERGPYRTAVERRLALIYTSD